MKLKKLPLFPLFPFVPLLIAGGMVTLNAFILRRLGRIARGIEQMSRMPPPVLPA